jgi:hypothetical protein
VLGLLRHVSAFNGFGTRITVVGVMWYARPQSRLNHCYYAGNKYTISHLDDLCPLWSSVQRHNAHGGSFSDGKSRVHDD